MLVPTRGMSDILQLFLLTGFLLVEKIGICIQADPTIFYCKYFQQLVRVHCKTKLFCSDGLVSFFLLLRAILCFILQYELMKIKRLNRSEEFDCWQSYLTDRSRYRLYEFFDTYRSQVADGSCPHCRKHRLPKYNNVYRAVRVISLRFGFLQVGRESAC